MVWSAYSLGSLNETAVPLQVANKEILQDVTDAETSIRGYVLTDGDSGSLQPYRVAIGYLPQDEQRLRELAQDDGQLIDALLLQEQSTQRWLEDYVEPQVDPARQLSGAASDRLQAQGTPAVRRRPRRQRRGRHGHRAHHRAHQRPGPRSAVLDPGGGRAGCRW